MKKGREIMKISPLNLYHSNRNFGTNYHKSNNVTILGSSKAVPDILDAMDTCCSVTKALVLSGRNIMTGCGSSGIMGAASKIAAKYSELDEKGKPTQNIAILKRPFWGDEDTKYTVVFDTVKTEGERVERFIETSDNFIVFPGGPGTILEASTLISNNYYSDNKRQVILVGKDYFKGLDEQYQRMYQSGLINTPPESLYTICDEDDEILDLILNK